MVVVVDTSTNQTMNSKYYFFFERLNFPEANSHKGQNGKLMIIGGSELFHAASKWSLDIASKFVDMVFYSSVPGNNDLISEAKREFWNGIIVERDDVELYIEEADVVLIGPGMDRSNETQKITNDLLSKFPKKKWVIDAGALQMIDPDLIPAMAILTPHLRELEMLENNGFKKEAALKQGVTILIKGRVDDVLFTDTHGHLQKIEIEGGNPGMTKGGTGDVLAGLVAALYATQDAQTAAVVGSVTNKAAGDSLYQNVGPFFNASDLVDAVPKVLWQLIQAASKK